MFPIKINNHQRKLNTIDRLKRYIICLYLLGDRKFSNFKNMNTNKIPIQHDIQFDRRESANVGEKGYLPAGGSPLRNRSYLIDSMRFQILKSVLRKGSEFKKMRFKLFQTIEEYEGWSGGQLYT